jgi:photosynthetic reaction center H subunit
MKGVIMGNIDVAQVVLYLFLIFFTGLIIYLRREDRREGYPLFSEPSNTYKPGDSFFIPPPKTFILPHGGSVQAPSGVADERPIRAAKIGAWPGAPLEPTGDPMLAAVGPGSYAERSNTTDKTVEGHAKIVPMRVARDFAVAADDGDPRGYSVVGADRRAAGSVSDIWVDRSEVLIRYLEVELADGRHVLLPMTFASIDKRRRTVNVHAIMSRQFAAVPATAHADEVTLLEEDKICAYYGGGMLYAEPMRTEPLL